MSKIIIEVEGNKIKTSLKIGNKELVQNEVKEGCCLKSDQNLDDLVEEYLNELGWDNDELLYKIEETLCGNFDLISIVKDCDFIETESENNK